MFKKTMSLALALLMILSLAACGGGGTTSAPSGTTSASKQVKNTLNIALNEAVATSDPAASNKDQTVQTFQWVYESLVYADGNAVVHPALAESWEIKNNGKDYVFKVRQGVKFHSGNTMTMDDIMFSYDRNLTSSTMKNYNSAIDSIEQTGDWEITFHLKEANNGFLYNLFVLKVVEKAIAEKEGENFGNRAHLAGTGPYYYESYEPNTLMVFKKFNDYWGECGNIETINCHVITNASTRVTALQTGEMDFITVPTASWDQIVSSGKFNTLQAEGIRTSCIIINHYREGSPLGDKRIRQAMKYAIDQDAVIKVAASGMGTKAEVVCNPTFIAGSTLNDELKESFQYNPEKAKELLKEAGYPNGLTIEHPFLVPNDLDNERVAQVLQGMWEAVGIKVTIEMAESATASAKSKEGYHDVYLTNSTMVHHMSNQKRAIHSNTYKTQVAKYGSAELDMYLDKAEQALTDKERDEWYLKANLWLDDMAVNIALYYLDKSYAWAKNLDATIGTYYLYVQEWNWT